MAQELSADTFKTDVLESDLPVLVDFWGPNCGPCQTLAPMIDKIADLTDGMAKVYKLNVYENQTVAAEYDVRGIPTVIIFEKGEEKERFVGVEHPQKYLEALGLETY